MRPAAFLLTLVMASATRAPTFAAEPAPLAARSGVLARVTAPLVSLALAAASEPLVTPAGPAPGRTLRLQVLARTEHIDVEPFDHDGSPRPEAFERISAFFRPRSGDEVPIDPRLVDLLLRISERLDDKPLVLVSGHREPGRGTSKKSRHVSGMAADIAVQGVGVQELRRAAIAEGAGGVGLYPSFVHVDVRDVPYRWVGGRWPRRR